MEKITYAKRGLIRVFENARVHLPLPIFRKVGTGDGEK